MALNDTYFDSTSELSIFQRILMTIIFGGIFILGVIGNVIVLIVSIRRQNYRFVTNCYIINLAITDLLFLFISVPLTTSLGLTETWILASLVTCQIHGYIAYVLLQATCYTLAVMSIDRYLYVISSHPRPQWRTPINALIICILIWIVSIAFPYLLLSKESEKKASNNCLLPSTHPLFGSCFFPLGAYYALPLIIISFCYTRLWFYMKNMSKSITRHKNNLMNRRRSSSKHRHVTRTLFSLTFAFAICWFPIHLLELLNCKGVLIGFHDEYPKLLDTIRVTAHALSYFNSCLNPVLYALYNKNSFI